MNYYEYYIQKEQNELADRCQDLCYNPIYFESIENSRKALPREVVELSLSLDSVMFHYKRHLVGYANRPNGLYRAVRVFIYYKKTSFLMLIGQALYYLHQRLIKFELYELASRMDIINRKLAKVLKKEYPGTDISFLESIDGLSESYDKLMDITKNHPKNQ